MSQRVQKRRGLPRDLFSPRAFVIIFIASCGSYPQLLFSDTKLILTLRKQAAFTHGDRTLILNLLSTLNLAHPKFIKMYLEIGESFMKHFFFDK